jgi:cation transporter-like permease
MAGAMASPSLLAVILYLAGAVQAQSVAVIGHAAMVPAMLAAMLYRRGDYTSRASSKAPADVGQEINGRPDPSLRETAKNPTAAALAATGAHQRRSSLHSVFPYRHDRL